jgi:hypothetical protein
MKDKAKYKQIKEKERKEKRTEGFILCPVLGYAFEVASVSWSAAIMLTSPSSQLFHRVQ